MSIELVTRKVHPFNPKPHSGNVVLITFCHVNRFDSINTLGKIQTGAPPPQSDAKEQLCPICTRCSSERSQGCFTAGGKCHVIGKVNPLHSQPAHTLTPLLTILGKFSLTQPEITLPVLWLILMLSAPADRKTMSPLLHARRSDSFQLVAVLRERLCIASGHDIWAPRPDFGLITLTSCQLFNTEHL